MDYEVKNYTVEWRISNGVYKEEFYTEEKAREFARKKLKTANIDSVKLIKESYAVDWEGEEE